jgi:hypothetical protein
LVAVFVEILRAPDSTRLTVLLNIPVKELNELIELCPGTSICPNDLE